MYVKHCILQWYTKNAKCFQLQQKNINIFEELVGGTELENCFE